MKQKLLKTLPENLSALAHFVSYCCKPKFYFTSFLFICSCDLEALCRLLVPLEALLLLLFVFQPRYNSRTGKLYLFSEEKINFFSFMCLIDIYLLLFYQVVKQRMQTGQFASAPDAVRLIVSKEGFKGLYAVGVIFKY